MRVHELHEAIADLTSVDVRPAKLGDDHSYLFTIPLDHNAVLLVVATVKGDVLEITDINTEGYEEHPDRFETTNQSWDAYSVGVRLGGGQMRRILRYVVQHVRQEHPNIRRVQAERRTGARYQSGQVDLKRDIT